MRLCRATKAPSFVDGVRPAAHVMLLNFTGYFRRTDLPLSEWDYEWFRKYHHFDTPNEFAEIVVSPDGRVTFTQRQELAQDRVITVRGERISRNAWQCAGARC